MKSRFPDGCVELCVFGCILAQTCGGSVKTHVQHRWFMRIHSWSIMGWKPCSGEPPEYALHSWCLLIDETGSSSWRQPCTFIPEPRQGGESAGKVASPPVASCFQENHVWQLKQILSLADAGRWVLLVSSARFGRLTAPCLLSSIEKSISYRQPHSISPFNTCLY